MSPSDPFGARAPLGPGLPDFYRLDALTRSGSARPSLDLDRLPVTIKILLENVIRHAGGGVVREADAAALAAWRPGSSTTTEAEIPFMPARVIMQDFTGVPAVVDLAAMRERHGRAGRRPFPGQPARARRPGHRSLGSGGSLRHVGRLRLQRRARVRAQRRALPAAALGPDRLRRPSGRPARHGHRPPGQPGVSGDRGDPPQREDGAAARSPSRTRWSGRTPTPR